MPASGVRLARTSDADEIAAVNVLSWRQRFADLLPAPLIDALDPRDLAMVWASSLLNPPSRRHRLLVAVDDQRAVGYAAVGPCADPDAAPDVAELLALEVDPDHQRRGHGSRLLSAAVDHARADGAVTVLAWCALEDQVRRSFLADAGWGPDGAYRDLAAGHHEGDDVVVREVRLAADIATEPEAEPG